MIINSFNKKLIQDFHKSIKEDKQHRYKSWEHCYKAFQTTNNNELLSLHLGFYLASWGMYRGSSGLLQKDYTVHQRAVEIILDKKYKPIHLTITNKLNFEDNNVIKLILDLKEELSSHYSEITYKKGVEEPSKITATDTLITKIMLGALGCVPAYDRYFKTGFKESGLSGGKLGKKSLTNLFGFIENNIELITKAQQELLEQGTYYPVMKIVDMYFFNLGMEVESNEKIRK